MKHEVVPPRSSSSRIATNSPFPLGGDRLTTNITSSRARRTSNSHMAEGGDNLLPSCKKQLKAPSVPNSGAKARKRIATVGKMARSPKSEDANARREEVRGREAEEDEDEEEKPAAETRVVTNNPGFRAQAVERFGRARRSVNHDGRSDFEESRNETVEVVELRKKLEAIESLVCNLRSEVLVLSEELGRMHNVNAVLETRNGKVEEELAAAKAKIAAFERDLAKDGPDIHGAPCQRFKEVQRGASGEMERPSERKEACKGALTVTVEMETQTHTVELTENKPKIVEVHLAKPPLPPPPPPPPLRRSPQQASSRSAVVQKAPILMELYHSLTKRESKKDVSGAGNCSSPVALTAHSSIVGEIQNRSAYLLAIKADVEKKGELIKFLIQKVRNAAFADIENVLRFVDWLDSELSSLADERAVLKHFDWPERKADAMREAAFEFRDLKRVLSEASSYEDNPSMTCETTLKKMTNLLNKLEYGIERLMKLRETTMQLYKDNKIPTDWMLDSGIMSKIKQASVKLAKIYMKRVSMELESARHSEKESMQEGLLVQGVRFAYRAHQFAGGLDAEAMNALEEVRQRVPTQGRGSRELLMSVAS